MFSVSEFSSTENEFRQFWVTEAHSAYLEAVDKAKILPPTNGIRLSTALNYSIFCYEILADHVTACDTAKVNFDAAMADLENMTEDDSYRGKTLLMQGIRGSLALWTDSPE